MSPVQIHQWQFLAPHASETMCYISCGISMIASLTLLQPNIADRYSTERIEFENMIKITISW